MLPLVPIAYELAFLGGGILLDRFFNRTSSTPNLPVPVPPSASTVPSIPTSAPVSRSRSRVNDLVDLATSMRTSTNQSINNIINNNTTNINNVANHYNTTNTNITNNTNNIEQSTNLLDVLKSNGLSSGLVASGLSDLTAVTASGVSTVGVVGGMIYNKLDELVIAVCSVASALYENGVNTAPVELGVNTNINNFDTASIVSAITSLQDFINPQTRLDFYDKFNQVNDFKLTPQTFTDLHGNDGFNISPLELRAKKDISVGVSHSLENSTTLSEVDTSDIYSNIDDVLLDDAMKLFNFNGISDNLEDLMANLINGNINYIPNVDLKG